MQQAKLGSISTGTLQINELIPAFCETLSNLDNVFEKETLVDIITDLCSIDERNPHAHMATYHETLNNLFVVLEQDLSEHAPPYAYFGSHPSDGTDYGFWPDWESINEGKHEGDLLQVDDLADVPEDCRLDHVLLINDHGNTTLYANSYGDWVEVWSVV